MNLFAPLRWLATPTGLVLLAAMALLGAGFVDGRHAAFTGIAGTGLFGLLVAKSLRRESSGAGPAINELHSELSALQRQLDGNYAGIDAADASVAAVIERLARIETEVAELRDAGSS